MDEVDLAVQIEPLSDAIKELKEQLTAFAMTTNAKLDTVADILNRQHDSLNQKLTALIQQTTPHSSCLFCSVEDNRDNHRTGPLQQMPAEKTSRRLASAAHCGKDHNVLICPIKASGASLFKRRKM
ncbi:hypothetical protein Q1695_000309 [Nippostrongylus brasiliensis]|nr:hypothetical protein Q1695_000309 [Nippostrongylus brasiliensis]